MKKYLMLVGLLLGGCSLPPDASIVKVVDAGFYVGAKTIIGPSGRAFKSNLITTSGKYIGWRQLYAAKGSKVHIKTDADNIRFLCSKSDCVVINREPKG